jgi:hypothetical protein
VHQARLSQLTRTASSLAAKLGNDDQRVKDAQAAVAASSATVRRVSMVYQQISTPPPKVVPGGWALYGQVVDATGNPVSRYTIFLVDAQKTYQQPSGFDFTDKTGLFTLNYAGPQVAGATPKSRSKAKDQAAPESAQQLFLGIVDTKAQFVYMSKTAFQPDVGNATYQQVILPAGGQSIGDPPPDIRQVAMPKPGKT